MNFFRIIYCMDEDNYSIIREMTRIDHIRQISPYGQTVF